MQVSSNQRPCIASSIGGKSLALLLLALCSSAVGADSDPASSSRAPNIVLILADDLGWDDVGYHGSEIRTPEIDALAAAGVTLGQFRSQPTCTPTRAALMTGKSPQRMGIYRQFAKNSTHGLPTTETTVADYLGGAGYQTWLVGKWHLGHAAQKYLPTARGFDHFYGHVTGGIGYWDHVHGGGLDWQRNGLTLREEGYSTHLLTKEAIKLIQRRDQSRPFFLYASFNAPHLPNEAPAKTVEAYRHIENPHRRVHAAMVTELDQGVGKIVAMLKQEGIFDNTLIWFMSDNGGLNRDAGMGGLITLAETLQDWFGAPLPNTTLEFIRTNALEGGSSNGPFRFGKGSIYEGGVRVPSLVHWPAALEPHHTQHIVTVQDVLPTLLSLIHSEIPNGLDGDNRLPVLAQRTAPPPSDFVTIGQNGAQAFYRWPWKLIADGEEYELYNLETDPYEARDLREAQSDQLATLIQELASTPRAPTVHIPLYRVLWDPDFFGGEEDRPPWADIIDSEQR